MNEINPTLKLWTYFVKSWWSLVGTYEMILLLEDFFGNWPYETSQMFNQNWLVVSTPLKNISQNGNLPQIGVKIKNIWNHHLKDNATLVTGLGLVVAHIRMIIGCWSHSCVLARVKTPSVSPYFKKPQMVFFIVLLFGKSSLPETTTFHMWGNPQI